MADDVVGFHAQQAVEKVLNVVLVPKGFRFRAPHDVEFLASRVRERNMALPPEVERARWLTPWPPTFATTSRGMRSR